MSYVHPDRLALIEREMRRPTAKASRPEEQPAPSSSASTGDGGLSSSMPPPPLHRRRAEVDSGMAAEGPAQSGRDAAPNPGNPSSRPSPSPAGLQFIDRPRSVWQPLPYNQYSPPPATGSSSSSNFSASVDMGAQKRSSDGEAKPPVGPHPSTIRVSAQYQTQAAIERRLLPPGNDPQERSIAEAKEDSLRLQGIQWLDVVRRALQLPVRTFTTACTYYHKFRLAHPPGTPTGDSYLWNDAAAASLLTACKQEDTLKKSRDILAASYNLKVAASEHLPSDDPMFEQQSRVVIGLERMVLESSIFDFRTRAPHLMLSKVAKTLGQTEEVKQVHDLAWTALTDLYRTFAPLKHTSATLALAMLELAARILKEDAILHAIERYDTGKVSTSREEIMETILDSLDLYIQHTTASTLGTRYSLDEFLCLRLALNKECNERSIPRHCTAPPAPSSTANVHNGHPTPVSPPQNDPNSLVLPPPIVLEHAPPVAGGTFRFMLNPQLAHDERQQVESYFKEEWEEYEEEIEVPLPRAERRPGPPSSRASSRERPPPRAFDDRRERERARVDREREFERERRAPPPRERDSRRYEDERRRYPDDRERRYDERRYDDRRERDERRFPRDNRR